MVSLKERRLADKKRRQRWLQRQKDKGNKAVTIMLTPEMQEILTEETDRTGRSKVEIVGKAILNRRDPATTVSIMRGERPPEPQKIIQRIKALQDKGKNQSQIADIFNSEGIKPFTGRGQWWPGTVRNLLLTDDGTKS